MHMSLHIVCKIIDALDGSMLANSILGKGTHFKIILPYKFSNSQPNMHLSSQPLHSVPELTSQNFQPDYLTSHAMQPSETLEVPAFPFEAIDQF